MNVKTIGSEKNRPIESKTPSGRKSVTQDKNKIKDRTTEAPTDITTLS